MYSFTSRIRFSEVDTHLNLTLGSVIDYFQDCSTFHSEAVGMNIARLSAMKRAWILSSWQIVPVLQDICQTQGMTVMIITHNSALAPMAHKVIRFRSGKVASEEINATPQPIADIEW